MPIIIMYATILVALILFACFHKQEDGIVLPSGRNVPADDRLVLLCTDQLKEWSFEDLCWLENYVITKPKNPEWDDLLRRIDKALNGF